MSGQSSFRWFSVHYRWQTICKGKLELIVTQVKSLSMGMGKKMKYSSYFMQNDGLTAFGCKYIFTMHLKCTTKPHTWITGWGSQTGLKLDPPTHHHIGAARNPCVSASTRLTTFKYLFFVTHVWFFIASHVNVNNNSWLENQLNLNALCLMQLTSTLYQVNWYWLAACCPSYGFSWL